MHERYGREQQFPIKLKLIFGYLNCRANNLVAEYKGEGGDIYVSEGRGLLFELCWQIFTYPRFDIVG